MATCRFCERTFKSAQGVRAHLKSCPIYQGKRTSPSPSRFRKSQSQEAHLRQLLADARRSNPGLTRRPYLEHDLPSVVPSSHRRTPDPDSVPTTRPRSAPSPTSPHTAENKSSLISFNNEEGEHSRKRAIVQQIKTWVVDWDLRWDPPIPVQAKAQVKRAIEGEFFRLPLLELPIGELRERAEAMREAIYARYLKREKLTQPISHHKERAMPKTRLLNGIYYCPSCDEEFELERTPPREAVCDDCGARLQQADEDDQPDDEQDT